MKTHLFSFLLVFTFHYFLSKIKFLRNFNIFIVIFILFNSYIFTVLNPVDFSELKEPFYLNKLHVAMPCFLSEAVESRINFSDKWCDEEDLKLSICNGKVKLLWKCNGNFLIKILLNLTKLGGFFLISQWDIPSRYNSWKISGIMIIRGIILPPQGKAWIMSS